jgi:hypothetical protein
MLTYLGFIDYAMQLITANFTWVLAVVSLFPVGSSLMRGSSNALFHFGGQNVAYNGILDSYRFVLNAEDYLSLQLSPLHPVRFPLTISGRRAPSVCHRSANLVLRLPH